MMPPLITVGSSPAVSRSAPIIEVVVGLAMRAGDRDRPFQRRISSASISARRTTGSRRARAGHFRVVGLTAEENDDDLGAVDIFGRVADPDGNAEPGGPQVLALSLRSLPCTR